jgi:hypothetical protein
VIDCETRKACEGFGRRVSASDTRIPIFSMEGTGDASETDIKAVNRSVRMTVNCITLANLKQVLSRQSGFQLHDTHQPNISEASIFVSPY